MEQSRLREAAAHTERYDRRATARRARELDLIIGTDAGEPERDDNEAELRPTEATAAIVGVVNGKESEPPVQDRVALWAARKEQQQRYKNEEARIRVSLQPNLRRHHH